MHYTRSGKNVEEPQQERQLPLKTKIHDPKRANSYRIKTSNCTDPTVALSTPRGLRRGPTTRSNPGLGDRGRERAKRRPVVSPRRDGQARRKSTILAGIRLSAHSPAPSQSSAVGQRATLINFPRHSRRSAAAAARPGRANERQRRHGAAYSASLKRAQRHQSLSYFNGTASIPVHPNCEHNK